MNRIRDTPGDVGLEGRRAKRESGEDPQNTASDRVSRGARQARGAMERTGGLGGEASLGERGLLHV